MHCLGHENSRKIQNDYPFFSYFCFLQGIPTEGFGFNTRDSFCLDVSVLSTQIDEPRAGRVRKQPMCVPRGN